MNPLKGDRFLYAGGRRISAYWVKRLPKGVPAHDVIRLRLRPYTFYMRPDEALAIAASLLNACWHYTIAKLGGRT